MFEMRSMYDILMELPLFKGLSSNDISEFLERTKINIENYEDGDYIVGRNEIVGRLGFILDGFVKFINKLYEDTVVVSSRLSQESWILPEILFGMVRTSPASVTSEGKSSIIWLEQSDLLRLMAENELCRINYLNYLCYKSQTRFQIVNLSTEESELKRWIRQIATAFSDRRSKSITITVRQKILAGLLNLDEDTLKGQLKKLIKSHAIGYANETILVKDRLEYF